MKTTLALTMLLILTISFSCQKNNFVSENQGFPLPEEKSARLIEGDNTFGLELYQKLSAERNEENILLSPLSVSVALAMAYNGADSDTRTEMEQMLKLNGLSTEEINSSYQKLLSALQSADDSVTFEIANALFYAQEFDVKSDFMNNIRGIYDAEISSLDFSSPSAVIRVNNWVNEKTNGKISGIINKLEPLDRMILLNAIYFYGTWSNLFEENSTVKQTFYKADGSSLDIPMMKKTEQLSYISDKAFRAVMMPYGEGQFNMIIILPENGQSTIDIQETLTAETWNSLMKEFGKRERIRITLPRFKFSYETSLKEVLTALNMKKAFIPHEADFTGISDDELNISDIRHKTFIDVNETGTEAAAVTGAVFETTSLTDETPVIPFVVNKPFIFAITERESGIIMFIGEVGHPEYDN